MTISFCKMHALGNDFAIINGLDYSIQLEPALIKELAHRHLGIGFDQLLLIQSGQDAHFFCRIFNADGSEAEQCGNGLRCVARFIYDHKLYSKPTFTLATKAGIFPVNVEDNDHINIIMGTPIITDTMTSLTLPQQTLPVSVISVGNPHTVLRVDDIETAPVHELGLQIGTHSSFPQGTNVGFMQIIDDQHIRLRTFERGSGETLACGSNACAAVVAGIANGWLKERVKVSFRYGSLTIEWDGKAGPISMNGPATMVFSGAWMR